MANETDNLLTITGPDELIDELLALIAGEQGPVDFTTVLPEPPADPSDPEEDGPDWWLANAFDARLRTREPGKAVLYFMTAWSPPVDWVEALAPRFPDLRITLLYAEAAEGVAGIWVYRDQAVSLNCVDVQTVGYPAVWSFLTSLGCDFGWEEPGSEEYDPQLVPMVG